MIKKKMLVVDDELAIATTLQMALEIMGYETTSVAASGDEAIKIAETEKPDLVLMDINLPGGMDGIQAAKEIYSRFGIGSIFVSGYPKNEMEDATKGPWCLDYISKPYSFDRLEKDLAVIIEKNIICKRAVMEP